MSNLAREETQQEKVVIPPNTRKQCTKCDAVLVFPKTVYSGMLPVRIACPYCQWEYRLDSQEDRVYLQFPKVDPALPSRGPWWTEALPKEPKQDAAKVSTGKSASKSLIDDLQSLPESMRQRSFRERADELAALTLSGFQVAESLRNDLAQFQEQFQQDMELRYEASHAFRVGWDPEYLEEFLDLPFLAMPMPTMNPVLDERSCLLLCPKFYRRLLGIPVTFRGGFYFQLILPYFVMGNPLDAWTQSLLQFPVLDLQVQGTRLRGYHLETLYKDIPGTVTDEEHTEQDPSLRMERTRHQETRMWLAERGVAPWSPLPTVDQALYPFLVRELPGQHGEGYGLFQKDFLATGRLAYLCEDHHVAVSSIKLLASCYKAPTLVILGSMLDRERWVDQEQAEEDAWNNRIAYHSWENFGSFLGWDEMAFIVLDLTGETLIPREFLDSLYAYRGRLLVLLDDAVQDTLEGNDRAGRIYGLVHHAHFRSAFHWKENFWLHISRLKGTMIQHALQALLQK